MDRAPEWSHGASVIHARACVTSVVWGEASLAGGPKLTPLSREHSVGRGLGSGVLIGRVPSLATGLGGGS
eukprot:9973047-Alexandrium_andersonii.AAC.1